MIIICVALALNFVFMMCLFSFWLGRCARRLPLIDDNLPWVMHIQSKRRALG